MPIWMEHSFRTGRFGILYVFLHVNNCTAGAWSTALLRVNPNKAHPLANYSNTFKIGSFYKVQAILLRTNQANSMKNSLYWETDSLSVRQEIRCSYGTQKLTSKTEPVLSGVNSVNALPQTLLLRSPQIYALVSQVDSYNQVFRLKFYMHKSCLTRVLALYDYSMAGIVSFSSVRIGTKYDNNR